jgi:hypothetical protein
MTLRDLKPRLLACFTSSLLLFLLIGSHTGHAFVTPTDAEIRQDIIRESIASYKATGHPCACPFDLARNGSSCGSRSAYSRPGGAAPFCYPQDVSDGMVMDWKKVNRLRP